MWRFFRLGINSNSCIGNSSNLRIVSTICSNSECEEKSEELCDDSNISSHKKNKSPSLASIAAHKYRNLLAYRKNLLGLEHQTVLKYDIKFKSVTSYQDDKLQQSNVRYEKKNLISPEIGIKGPKNLKKNLNLSGIKDSDKLNDRYYEFGKLSKIKERYELLPEEDEISFQANDNKHGDKLSPHMYGRKILNLCKKKKLIEALKVLETEMKVQNVIPDTYCYNILINACGKVGYTKKAFELYNQMKERDIKPGRFAYTGLFNACANSPFSGTEEIKYANRLRKELNDKKILLHPITYHAMIKGFGRCNDINTAFEIVDEMIKKKYLVSTETMNFLLQACITDKNNGFRHALMVWHKMRKLRISPDIYSYNLLLRCVKECQAGDPRLINELLEVKDNKKTPSVQERALTDKNVEDSVKAINQPTTEHYAMNPIRSVCHVKENNEIVNVDLAENMEMEIYEEVWSSKEEPVLPNLLSSNFNPGKVTEITSLSERQDRLLLLGGIFGILKSMSEDKVKPTNATFTNILDSLPSLKELEITLLSSMEKCEVVPDVIFFNKLIRKRCKRRKLNEAKEVLDLMQKHRLTPDIVTFSCLAIGCYKPSTITKLLKDMHTSGLTPPIELMNTVILNSLKSQNYEFTIELLRRCKELEITPSEVTLKFLESARNTIRRSLIKQENGETISIHKKDEMKLFLMEYSQWLKNSDVDLQDHPWAQYGHRESRERASKDV